MLDLDPVFKYGGPTAKRKHLNLAGVFKHDLRSPRHNQADLGRREETSTSVIKKANCLNTLI